MNKTIKSRKGATLAEIIIVLAVLVIASGMVVSFSSMMHGAQGISNARHEALRDVRTAEALIEGFIENNAATVKIEDGAVGQRGDALYIGNSYEEKTSFVFLSSDGDGNALIYVASTEGNSGENKPLVSLKSIQSINYETVGDNNDTLYYCTITYSVSDTEYTYTFCVNPYVGE